MKTVQIEIATPRGNVVVWKSWQEGAEVRQVVLLVPGFAQRMRHIGAIAQYLVANGAVVYRFDSLAHVGLSDGSVREFNGSMIMHSLEAVSSYVRKAHDNAPMVGIAISLMARALVRFAAGRDWFRRIVLLVGVVDGRATLKAALGCDYLPMPEEELPATVEIERQAVDPRYLWRDERQNRWGGLEPVIDELRQVKAGVVNFISSTDEWVDPAHVEEAFKRGNGGPRYIVSLPEGAHKIAANPVALREVLDRITRVALADDQHLAAAVSGERDQLDEMVIPSFEEMAELLVSERKWEREQTDRGKGGTTNDQQMAVPATASS
jgi:hypothetical protein